jgi:transposase InsO family protein
VYVAFIVDVFSRRILGWRVATSKQTPLVTDALHQALTTRPRKILGWRTPAEVFEEQLRSLPQTGVATTP